MNNLSVKGVIERPYCNAFVPHCVISPCTLLKLLISSEYAFNQRSECSELCWGGRGGENTDAHTTLELVSSRFVAVSTPQKGECIALSFIRSRLIGDGKAFQRGEKTAFCGRVRRPDAREEKRGSGGVWCFQRGSSHLSEGFHRLLWTSR